MQSQVIKQMVAFAWLLSLAITLANIDAVSGCRKPLGAPGRSLVLGWSDFSPTKILECVEYVFDKYRKLPKACCDVGLCANPKSVTKAKRYAKQMLSGERRTLILVRIGRCILNIITQNEERFKLLDCCRLIPFPFWC